VALSDLMNSLLRVEKVLQSRSEFVKYFEQTRRKLNVR
jgi:hypothetical protein